MKKNITLNDIDNWIKTAKYEEYYGFISKNPGFYENNKNEIAEIFKKYSCVRNYFVESLNILNNLHKLSSQATHSTLIGNCRESFVKNFLLNILPSDIEYKTGQVTNVYGKLSNQLDIILQKSNSPKLTLDGDNQLCFYESVMAVIEVKSSLTDDELQKVLNQFKTLGGFQLENKYYSGRSYEYRSIEHTEKLGIPCILVAYKGLTKETLLSKLTDFSKGNYEYFKKENVEFLPDLIINLERSYALIRNNGLIHPFDESKDKLYIEIESNVVLSELFLYLNKVFEYHKERNMLELYLGTRE